jgi:hypothetical protein
MLKKYYYFKQYNNKDILNLYSNIGVFFVYITTIRIGINKQKGYQSFLTF